MPTVRVDLSCLTARDRAELLEELQYAVEADAGTGGGLWVPYTNEQLAQRIDAHFRKTEWPLEELRELVGRLTGSIR